MKKRQFFLPIMALLLHACAEDAIVQIPAGSKIITAVIESSAVSSRTCMDESDKGTVGGVLWSPGDVIGVYSTSGIENAPFTGTNTVSTGEAQFTGALSNEPAYAYYPYNANNNGTSILTGELPLIQEYSSTDGKLAYDYKIGKPKVGSSTEFSFTHLFALLRFTVDASGTALENDKLEQIILTFPEGVNISSGTFTVPVSGGDVTWNQISSENELIMKWSDTPALAEGTTHYGYLACPAVNGLTDKEVAVTLQSTKYNVSFTASLQVNGFDSNAIYTFPLTLSKWAEKLGDAFKVTERPVLTSISFTAANNNGKILAKKLYYSPTEYTKYTSDISETTQTMYIENGEIVGHIPYLFDRNLIPTLTYTSGAIIYYSTDNGASFIQWDGKSSINFSNGNIIRVSKNNVNSDYVINITNTGLPIVVVNQPEGDVSWSQVGENVWSKDTDFDNVAAGDITVYNADGTIDLATIVSRARLRGNTSLDFPKKPFAVKLDTKSKILGMSKHKRWVLLANWKDKSLMRNHVAFGIARKFTETFKNVEHPGIPWNVNGQFVELVYNGVHVGNYYLCEQIKIDGGRLAINEPYDSKTYPTITEDDLGKFGYLIECDDNYDEEENGQFLSKHFIPVMLKDAGDASNTILNYIKNKIVGIEDNLYNGNYSTAYNDIDIYSFADMLLIYEMAMNSEMGHPKSAYMYVNGTGKLCAGPVWDFDWTSFPHNENIKAYFDSSWDRYYNQSLMATASHKNLHYRYKYSGYPSAVKKNDVPYLWYPMMIKDATFQTVLADRWQTMSTILEAYAEELIKETGKKIALSWEYNNAVWPAYYSDNCDRQQAFSGGFCGDEKMSDFTEIYTSLYDVYMERLNGMNSFVINKTWPSWTISTATK